MEKIIKPIDKKLIKSELTRSLFVRNTNYGNNEIYIFTAHQCPNTIKEIGRLREIAFRDSGGGSGKSIDIDKFDTKENPYKQIVVWNPDKEEIIGGYRFFKLKDAPKTNTGKYNIATANMFKLSDKFIKEYLPYTMELGKSFIQPKYQPTSNPKLGMFSLDNLWDGLGALIVDNQNIKYFYGRVTLYLNYDKKARDILLHFLYKYFGDKENLVTPYAPEIIKSDRSKIDNIFKGKTFEEDFTYLNQVIRNQNENIPPLIKAYMSLSPSMKTFGTAFNYDFGGNVEGIAIMVKIEDIYPSKKRRHIQSYLKQKTKIAE